MLRTTLAGLRAHKLRLLLTSLAIALGVGFIAGTFVLTDTIEAGLQPARSRPTRTRSTSPYFPRRRRGRERAAVCPAPTGEGPRASPGVADAQGLVRGTRAADRQGRQGGRATSRPRASPSSPGALNRTTITSGTGPATATQAVLDENTAKTRGFTVGDTISVLDAKEARARVHGWSACSTSAWTSSSPTPARSGSPGDGASR